MIQAYVQALKLSPGADHIWGYLQMVIMNLMIKRESQIEQLVQGINAGIKNKIWNLIENRNLEDLSVELDKL